MRATIIVVLSIIKVKCCDNTTKEHCFVFVHILLVYAKRYLTELLPYKSLSGIYRSIDRSQQNQLPQSDARDLKRNILHFM